MYDDLVLPLPLPAALAIRAAGVARTILPGEIARLGCLRRRRRRLMGGLVDRLLARMEKAGDAYAERSTLVPASVCEGRVVWRGG